MSTNESAGRGVAALVIHPDCTLVEVLLEAGRVLEGMYGAIGCRCVDVVRLDDSMDMWVDDEGMLVGEVNRPATRLARSCGFVWQPYFGVVVVTGGADRDGNTVSLAAAQMAEVRGLLTEPPAGLGRPEVCAECGHRHLGAEWGSICVGCPCPV
ncbi:MAG TPA: DUF3846 domain-containing protein [Nakamurella sp.]|jgi:Domain of unknown function (DUF3846)|nr:DUF3846 domain-containing protein [Nakamurella sp.]